MFFMKKLVSSIALFVVLASITSCPSSMSPTSSSPSDSPTQYYSSPQKSNVSPSQPSTLVSSAPSGSSGTTQLATVNRSDGSLAKKTDTSVSSKDEVGNTEDYSRIYDNPFLEVTKNPLSTFSIDVDTASYANLRRYITSGSLPPKDAVRIEEMINYFTYEYPEPKGEDPFSINFELSDSPWKKGNKIVSIGIQGKKLSSENLPQSNIVFLIDTSGSMSSANKLPLLKEAFKLLVNQLTEKDRVSIVTYAGSAGLVLSSTKGNEKSKIINALDSLQSGGSTAGGQGLNLAYNIAKENFIKEGNNRVILATDGDFNVGASSDSELVRLIEEKRKEGVFLSVLGFGMGNYKDSKMEQLADKGNGNYAYIDTMNEAKKVFVKQLGGTLLTIAKDVKLQLEFNPVKVKAYRLIGYENRVLKNEDFNNDQKDAGDLGSGHTVTALYELTPSDSQTAVPEVDKLKYQDSIVKPESFKTDELMTVKLRYKEPTQDTSKLITNVLADKTLEFSKASENLRFASSVAGFGMMLRDSEYKGDLDYDKVLKMAKDSKGQDLEGYRSEFISLVEKAINLKK